MSAFRDLTYLEHIEDSILKFIISNRSIQAQSHLNQEKKKSN